MYVATAQAPQVNCLKVLHSLIYVIYAGGDYSTDSYSDLLQHNHNQFLIFLAFSFRTNSEFIPRRRNRGLCSRGRSLGAG